MFFSPSRSFIIYLRQETRISLIILRFACVFARRVDMDDCFFFSSSHTHSIYLCTESSDLRHVVFDGGGGEGQAGSFFFLFFFF